VRARAHPPKYVRLGLTPTTPMHRMPGRIPNYDKFPWIPGGPTGDCHVGWDAVCGAIRKAGRKVIVVDAYAGVRRDDLLRLAAGLEADTAISTERALKSAKEIDLMVAPDLTADPIFGRITKLRLRDFFDGAVLQHLRDVVEDAPGTVVVYGTGASLVTIGDLLIFADMPRREAQLRQRRGEIGNLGADNAGEDPGLQYKRAFFIDWRVCDAHKRSLFDRMDFILDTATSGEPKLVQAQTVFRALDDAAHGPFRVVPWFDPAPWGGRWLMEVCDLDRDAINYGWGFDCVPEENSVLLRFGDVYFETPSLNLVYRTPRALLGTEIVEHFGQEFPIRFDFLDTMEGGNLSLQVHPLTEYIRAQFGVAYTQDESYYVMDAGLDASVYLGLREGVDPNEMMADLRRAEKDDLPFPDERHVNRFPARRHDHFLIPAGTVHCSGANSVVLEISATPYLFTFKLWDWGRLGLEGKPRPLHIDHGEHSIQWNRDTGFVERDLMNRVERTGFGEGWIEERTGLHESEFIETRRHWFTKTCPHNTRGGLNVLNLVSGEAALVESPDDAFEPLVVHYAETFIVPASVGSYTVRPYDGTEATACATIKAFVRGPAEARR
jgi:mannose-6-phosphate isomerase class I